MDRLTKTDLKNLAKREVAKTLLNLYEKKGPVNEVPLNQEDEYKEILEAQCERVMKFLGF